MNQLVKIKKFNNRFKILEIMRKIFSIIALTVFMAGNLNAMPLPKKSCEDDAWDLAETIYYLSK
ncbi:MAG: hypothetical protein ABI295_02470, partial [Xanthomarina sp.]